MLHHWRYRVRVIFIFVWGTILYSSHGHSSTVSGRVTLGTYDGIENLSQPSAGQYTNDVATVSGRFYLRVSDVGPNKFEFISDIRDKNDFYGQVDSQDLQLVNANIFQARQLSALYPGHTYYTQVGRFPVFEAGPINTDGVLQGVHLSQASRVAVFGGLDSKRPEQTFVQYNPDSQVFGTYFSYVHPNLDWGHYFVLDTAAVTNIVQNLTDRTYWYTSSTYQWNPMSRVSVYSYLDFVPQTYIQSGSINYQQGVGKRWLVGLSGITLNVLEYQHLQSVRSLIPSSPYDEATGKARYTVNPNWSLELSYSNGLRALDGLRRQETLLSSDFLKVFSRHWDLTVGGGYRDNFISLDTFGMGRISYFSDLWELGLDEQFAVENYKTGGFNYHPIISELSVSRTFNNALYGTFSFQDVHDERVQISTVFAKFSYRFGSKEIPPVRDGAPPRGRL